MLIGLLPVFNEEETITTILDKLERQVDYTVIVNDGSFDRTDFLISDWIKGRNNIRYLSFKKNRGMSYALLEGFYFILEEHKKGKFSHEDIIITIDADNQHDPNDISKICDYFKANKLDVLIAKRDFSNYPRHRILGNRLLSSFASFLSSFRFNDIECGFKFLRLDFISNLSNYYVGYRYSCAGEIGIAAALLGYKVDNQYKIETPYHRNGRTNFIDFFVDIFFYFLTFSKIKFSNVNASRLKNHRSQDNPYLQREKSLAPLAENKQ